MKLDWQVTVKVVGGKRKVIAMFVTNYLAMAFVHALQRTQFPEYDSLEWSQVDITVNDDSVEKGV